MHHIADDYPLSEQDIITLAHPEPVQILTYNQLNELQFD